jgi:hypothetical protein
MRRSGKKGLENRKKDETYHHEVSSGQWEDEAGHRQGDRGQRRDESTRLRGEIVASA